MSFRILLMRSPTEWAIAALQVCFRLLLPGQRITCERPTDRRRGTRTCLRAAALLWLSCRPSGTACFSPTGHRHIRTDRQHSWDDQDGTHGWFQSPHPNMPNLILEPGDQGDVIAYIVSRRTRSEFREVAALATR